MTMRPATCLVQMLSPRSSGTLKMQLVFGHSSERWLLQMGRNHWHRQLYSAECVHCAIYMAADRLSTCTLADVSLDMLLIV